MNMTKFRILIQTYLGYTKGKPHYGKARQLTITTELTLNELRDKIAEDYGIPIRDVGRPSREKD